MKKPDNKAGNNKEKKENLERRSILEAIFDQSSIGIAISYDCDKPGSKQTGSYSINDAYKQITGRSQEELLSLGWEKITHPDDVKVEIELSEKLKKGEIGNYSLEKRFIKPDGSLVWVSVIVAPISLSEKEECRYICLVQDITSRKLAESALLESERSKSVLLSHFPGMAYRCKYDKDWTMLFVSEGCFNLTGYKAESLLYNKDLSFNDIISPEYQKALWNRWKEILENKEPFKYEYEIITAEKTSKWVIEMGEGIFDERGEVIALEGIVLDISDRKRMENDLRHRNEHNRLTGLHNRVYLEKLLLEDSKSPIEEKRAIISINLGRIHLLNMSYGFHYMQNLMKMASAALKTLANEKY